MRILVTGGLGFIGSNFILNLLKNYDEYDVINLDDELYGSNHLSLQEIEKSPHYKFVKGNINDYKLTEKLISNSDVIINFAAESFVDRSIANAKPFLESNISGVFTLLEILKNQKKRFVHISTDEVYGSLNQGSATENSRFNPTSPYSATKASSELLINAYNESYDCDNLITRCTNNYGPRQFPEKLIPKVIFLANNNQKIPVYGTGKNIRDWLFVEDHCSAILQVLLKGKSGKSYNISAGNELDNLTIIKTILRLMNKSDDLIEFVEDRPGHDFRYSLDSSKIKSELNWLVKTDFDKGIEQTINWYLSNQQWWKNISEKALDKTPWKNKN